MNPCTQRKTGVNIVLIGRTGSGKSTLGGELERDLSLPHIASGEIARELGLTDPSTSLALQQGAMAPEASMRARIRQEIESAELSAGGWILDGFPRMTEQVICLMQWTTQLPLFVYLDLEPWLCIERLTARGRPDDNPDSIARKLASFSEKTQPMLELLEGGGVLHTIHADGTSPADQSDQVRALCL